MTLHVQCHHLFQKPSPYRLLLKNNNPYFRFMWPCIINVGEERTNRWHRYRCLFTISFISICFGHHYNPYFRIVLYGCETWSITRREEHRLRVCEDRVLGETTGGNRMVGTAVALRNMRWAGHVARRHKRNVQENKPEGKAHLQVVSVELTSISCVHLTARYRNQRAWQW